MSIIRTVPEGEANGLVADLYASDRAAQGYVAPHTAVMAMNPEAEVAFENLVRAILSGLDLRRYELVTLAAARGARSAHCRLAHGRKSLGLFSEEQLTAIARDHRSAGLSPAEVAMMDFAEQAGRDPAAMTEADSLRLREHGFTDREIVDIALAASVRRYYSGAIQALAVPVDVPPTLPAGLAESLVAGL
ncbi:MAG: carboxymuconolactone decarboxylase family protein [Herbiconiux sp.]|nr:carboxymuconolactone decarboxylase family protein [Herbiconiux sp.]